MWSCGTPASDNCGGLQVDVGLNVIMCGVMYQDLSSVQLWKAAYHDESYLR